MDEIKVKDTNKAERQIYILSLLSENPKGYRVEEIQERLKNWDIEVTKRTISRDIDELSVNYGIGEEERNGKTYYYADKYTLRNVDLTIEDLASFAFAKEVLSGYSNYNMGKHAIQLIEKMVDTSTTFNKKQFDTLCGQFKQVGIQVSSRDHVDSKVEREIQNAIDNHNKVELDYYSFSSDETMRRVVHPYRMLVLDNYLCVEGYCELRKEVRRFRLSRIQGMDVLDAKFDESELLSFTRPQTFLKLAGGREEALELLFTGQSIRYVKEYESARASKLQEEEDGLHFYQNTAIAEDVIRWIRSFGPDVKVVKPKWLEKQLMEEAEERLKNN